MRQKRIPNRTILVTVIVTVAAAAMLWIGLGEGSDTSQLTALAIEVFCIGTLLWVRAKTKARAVSVARCELCNRPKGPQTDDMAWAREYGLDACHDCSFKMQVAFGNVGVASGDRILH